MYLVFLMAIIVYVVAVIIRDVLEKRNLQSITITEPVRVKKYVQLMVWGNGALLVTILMSVFYGISFYDIGLRSISFNYNIWVTIAMLILCGLLLLILPLYQISIFLISTKHREASEKEFASWDDNSPYAKAILLMTPKSKKEKKLFFGVCLTSGIGEEIVFRGFLFFILQSLMPNASVIFILFIASAIFGVGHLYQGLHGVIKTAIIGGLFGGLFLVTNSLLPVILLHFLGNWASSFMRCEMED